MKKCMELLLSLPASQVADYQLLSDMGVNFDELSEDEVTNMLAVNAALLKQAKMGDVAAVKELRSIIRDDDMMRHRIRYDNARLKLDRERYFPSVDDREGFSYGGIPASMVAPAFSSVLFDIAEGEHSEYVFPGGRGSAKSSFISLAVIDLLEKNEDMHACILRQVGNTLKDSVYNQMLWAISSLGLDDEYAATKSPLEITKTKTGQKIYFRGADDENKIKSIKVPFGFIGILWFEELDQFDGPEEVRNVEQTVLRGGSWALTLKSFNPPAMARSWVNRYALEQRPGKLVHHSTYRDLPRGLLGERFWEDAAHLERTNPAAYRHEYGGEVVGNRTRAKVVKNKVAPPFREAEFDIMYGEGISLIGELIDLGVKLGLVQKSGSWYSMGETRIGQGRDAAKQYLKNNPEIADNLEAEIRRNFDKLMTGQSRVAAKAAGRAVDVSADDFKDED